jgi:hypothetical protein
MLRMTDLDSGKSVDLTVQDIFMECFREQIDRGLNPRNLEEFRGRLGHEIEEAIADAVDLSLQPPFTAEITQAYVLASALGIPIPKEALRRRLALTRFFRAHGQPWPLSSEIPTNANQQGPLGKMG